MQQGSNKNSAIIGIIAIVIIAGAVIGTIALKPQSNTASGNNGSSTSSTTSDSTTTSTNIDPNATYKNGTYTASGSYSTPESTEDIEVTITVSNNKITEASVSQQASSRESRAYQADFASGYKSQVVGKDIATLQLSRVSGSSLTPRGFNEALNIIRSQAKS